MTLLAVTVYQIYVYACCHFTLKYYEVKSFQRRLQMFIFLHFPQVQESVPLTLYQNGILMFAGPFRSFEDKITQVMIILLGLVLLHRVMKEF